MPASDYAREVDHMPFKHLRPLRFHKSYDLLGDGAWRFFWHVVPTALKHTAMHIVRDKTHRVDERSAHAGFPLAALKQHLRQIVKSVESEMPSLHVRFNGGNARSWRWTKAGQCCLEQREPFNINCPVSRESIPYPRPDIVADDIVRPACSEAQCLDKFMKLGGRRTQCLGACGSIRVTHSLWID